MNSSCVLIRLATARGSDTDSAVRFTDCEAVRAHAPPMNRRAIFIRPLRGLVYQNLDTAAVPVDDSSVSFASIQHEIDKLEPAERAALIDVLWDSLDEERTKETEFKWAAESEDRIDAFERGELTAVDGPSALEELRSFLRISITV